MTEMFRRCQMDSSEDSLACISRLTRWPAPRRIAAGCEAENAGPAEGIVDIDAHLLTRGLRSMMNISSAYSATNAKQEASTSQKIVYVEIDVDDTRYHGSAMDQCTGEVLDFQ
jgi:hypothetical protein